MKGRKGREIRNRHACLRLIGFLEASRRITINSL